MGSKHPTIAPYQAFETSDGYVVVAVGSEAIWERFCAAIDREDLLEDDRFATNAERVENRDALDPLLAEEMASYDTETVLDRLDEHDVPASDVKNMEQIFSNPQVLARGMRASVPHPTAGEVEMAGSPMHFSRTPTEIWGYPPRLGEHTDEVLAEHGFETSTIDDLYEQGVLGDRAP
jgi:crotonobetainyl-CoA:carnitine CoA-transferase CaiB-like acyl-CoA transferase